MSQPAAMPVLLMVVHSAKMGGAERMALEEARRLRHHFELVIAVPDGPLAARFRELGSLVDRCPSLPLWGASGGRWLLQSARTVADALRLARLMRQRHAVGVVAGSAVSLSPTIAAKIAGVPSIVHVRDVPVSRLARRVFRVHARLASAVVLIAHAMEPLFAGGRAETVLIRDGIRFTDRPTPEPPGGRDELRLCLIGALDPRKGQLRAVEALAEVRRAGRRATLDLIGRTEHEEYAAAVRRTALDLGVHRFVRFLGPVPDAGSRIVDYDLLVVPSLGEWTPLTIMEALACGRPVVASDVGGVRETLRGGDFGVLVAPDDARALADGIASAASSSALSARVAAEAPSWVRQAYSVEETTRRAEELVLRLCGGSGDVRDGGGEG